MKPIHYILIFGTVILALFIFFNWEKVKALFSKEKPAPILDAYDECVKKHQSLPDGADCTNCIPIGSQVAVFNGKIKDGKCEPIRADVTPEVRISNILQISNPAGAFIYIFSGGIFQQTRGGIVPYGKQFRILQIANSLTQGIFYKTTSGWLSKNDVVI